jgi:hypothetical protein
MEIMDYFVDLGSISLHTELTESLPSGKKTGWFSEMIWT